MTRLQKHKACCAMIAMICTLFSTAQRQDLKGQLLAKDDIEGIHIQNTTAAKYAISEQDGSFVILAKRGDTLLVSGLKYETQKVPITNGIIKEGVVRILLIEKINTLKEIVLGTMLTGSLDSDIGNSDAKADINFYDLGIPGFIGVPLTQNERKLHDADAGSIANISGGNFGGGVGLNLHKILNKITGRTKKLKAIVLLDKKEDCIERLRSNFGAAIFENDPLAEEFRNEYFMFCLEDPHFIEICAANNDINAIEFMQRKLKVYKQNQQFDTKD